MYIIEYIFCRIAIFILLLFPEKYRFKFGDFLGEQTYKFLKKRREIAHLNLHLAFPEKTEEEITEIAKKSFKIMIKSFMCTIWMKEYLENSKNIKIVDEEKIEKLMKKNKKLIVATMHMGNMESSLKCVENYEIVTVAKSQRNPYINNFMKKNRDKCLNMEVIEKSHNTSKELLQKIKEEKIFALFSDHRDKGANIKFFSKEAKAPTGAITLALKYSIPLVIVYNVMNDDNSSTVYISDELELDKSDNKKKDILDNTQKLINEMEKIIKKYPEQWMWFHDRWNLYSKLKKERKNKGR